MGEIIDEVKNMIREHSAKVNMDHERETFENQFRNRWVDPSEVKMEQAIIDGKKFIRNAGYNTGAVALGMAAVGARIGDTISEVQNSACDKIKNAFVKFPETAAAFSNKISEIQQKIGNTFKAAVDKFREATAEYKDARKDMPTNNFKTMSDNVKNIHSSSDVKPFDPKQFDNIRSNDLSAHADSKFADMSNDKSHDDFSK